MVCGMQMNPCNHALSYWELHRLADDILAEYGKQLENEGMKSAIDPQFLVEKILGFHVAFVAFAGKHAPLGFSSTTEGLGVPILLPGNIKSWYFLDGKTILVEKRREMYNGKNDGSFRFTILHEASHLLLNCIQGVVLPGNVMEYQANTLAMALLLPDSLLEYAMFRFGFGERIHLLNPKYATGAFCRFLAMSEYLHVSSELLAWRLKETNRLAKDQRSDPEVYMAERMKVYAKAKCGC